MAHLINGAWEHKGDFLSETFVPSTAHRKKQIEYAAVLFLLGHSVEQVAEILTVPVDELKRGLADLHDRN